MTLNAQLEVAISNGWNVQPHQRSGETKVPVGYQVVPWIGKRDCTHCAAVLQHRDLPWLAWTATF